MNGKKAKLLRKQLKSFGNPELQETKYTETNVKERVVPFMKPKQIKIGEEETPVLDENGVQLLDESGEPKTRTTPITVNAPHSHGNPFSNRNNGIIQFAKVRTSTKVLDMCMRKMYQDFKKSYKADARG